MFTPLESKRLSPRTSKWSFVLAASLPSVLGAQCPVWDAGIANSTVTTERVCGIETLDFNSDSRVDMIRTGQTEWYRSTRSPAGTYTTDTFSLPAGLEFVSNPIARTGTDSVALLARLVSDDSPFVLRVSDLGSATPTENLVSFGTLLRHPSHLAADGDRLCVSCTGQVFSPGTGGVLYVRADDTHFVITTGNEKAGPSAFVDLDGDAVLDVACMRTRAGGFEWDLFQCDPVTEDPAFVDNCPCGPPGATADAQWGDYNQDGLPDFVASSSDLLSQATLFTVGLAKPSSSTRFSASDYDFRTASTNFFTLKLEAGDMEALTLLPYRRVMDVTCLDGLGNLHHCQDLDLEFGGFDAVEAVPMPAATPIYTFVTRPVVPDEELDLIATDLAGANTFLIEGIRRALVQEFGDPCGSVALTGTPPVAPGSVTLTSTGGAPNRFGLWLFAFDYLPSPLNLAPSCDYYLDPATSICNLLDTSDGVGDMSETFQLPAAAIGADLFVSSAIFNPSGAFLNLLDISNPARVSVGAWARP